MPNQPRYCLNTSTIAKQKSTLVEKIELAAKAGYHAIEPWIRELIEYRDAGGSLADLRKRLSDHNLAVPSAIGFAAWIVDDDTKRAAGMEEARRDFDLMAQIGGTGIAAPPVGAHETGGVDPLRAAERFGKLIDLSKQFNVIPMLEVWGFSKQLNRLGEAMYIASECGHDDATLLLDIYHLYKGGSGDKGMNLLGPDTVRMFHMNDYPANFPRETIRDADRVWPGDGIAPIADTVRRLRKIGFHGWFSLELFNENYYQLPAAEAATIGLQKMKHAVESAW